MKSVKHVLRLALPTLAVLATSPLAADDYVQLSTGIDYSSGDYGDVADTDMLAIDPASDDSTAC